MAYDFPNSPTAGQIITAAGQRFEYNSAQLRWEYLGAASLNAGGGGITVPNIGFGTVTWGDGATTLTSTGCVQLSLNSATWSQSIALTTGTTFYTRWDPSAACDGATHGTTITGTIADAASGTSSSYTKTIDKIPGAISLSSSTASVAPSTVTSAVSFTVSGLTSSAYLWGALTTTSGGTAPSNAQYSLDGVSYSSLPTAAGTVSVNDGDTVYVRFTTGNTASTTDTLTVKVGENETNKASATYTVSVSKAAFSGTAPTAPTVADTTTTSCITWDSGADTIYATGCLEFSVAGGAFTQSNTAIANGQTLCTRWKDGTGVGTTCADAVHGTTITGTIESATRGSSASLTLDRQPAAFNFTDLTSQATSTAVTSNMVTLSGMNTVSYLQWTPDATNPLTLVQASINSGAYVAVPAAGTYTLAVKSGDTVTLRGTTGAAASTSYLGTVTIGDSVGSTTDTWTVATSAFTPTVLTPQINNPTAGSVINPTVNNPSGVTVTTPASGTTGGFETNYAGTQLQAEWYVYEADLICGESASIISATSSSSPGYWVSHTSGDLGLPTSLYGSAGKSMTWGRDSGGTPVVLAAGDPNFSQAGVQMFRSLDGGVTFDPLLILDTTKLGIPSAQSTEIPDMIGLGNEIFMQVKGIDAGHGNIPNPGLRIYKSGDGGDSWTQVYDLGARHYGGTFATDGTNTIAFLDAKLNTSFVWEYYLVVSTNSGATWTTSSASFDGPLVYSGTRWMYSSGTTIKYGAGLPTTASVNTPTTASGYATNGTNWVYVDGADIYRSTNSGSSWTAVSTIDANGVTFQNGVFIATTSSGAVHQSADNGATWTLVANTGVSGLNATSWEKTPFGTFIDPEIATGSIVTNLTFSSDANLLSMSVGDRVVEYNGGMPSDASGTITAIAPGGPTMSVSTSSGTWTVGSTVANISGTCAAPSAPAVLPPASPSALYTPVAGYPLTLTTAPFNQITIPEASLNPDKAYFASVIYTGSGGPIDSIASPWVDFTTVSSFAPQTGQAYGGGFFVGQILGQGSTSGGGLDDKYTLYNLIVAPLGGALEGQNTTGLSYKTASSSDGVDGSNAVNDTFGKPATVSLADSNHPLFNWAVNSATGPNAGTFDATNAAGTGLGGYNDWYVPSYWELHTIYGWMKPTADPNYAGSYGTNPLNYWTSSPPYTQTTDPAFQSGGSQAFSSGYYGTSTQGDGNLLQSQYHTWSMGNLQRSVNTKITTSLVRAVRRVPA